MPADAINALTVMLLEQQKFFLNIGDEPALFERAQHLPLNEIDLASLAAEASSPAVAECLKAQVLLPRYADQPLLREKDTFTREQWLPAFDAMYLALLAREEP